MPKTLAATAAFLLAASSAFAQDGTFIEWVLNVGTVTYDTAALSWPMPGEEEGYPPADSFDVRHRTAVSDPAHWGESEDEWGAADTVDVTGEPMPDPGIPLQTMTLTGLQPGTRYYVAIRASLNGGEAIAIGHAVVDTVPGDEEPPGAPTLNAVTARGTSLVITWTSGMDGEEAVDLDVIGVVPGRRSDLTEGTWAAARQIVRPYVGEPGGEVTWTLAGLEAETDYAVGLRSRDTWDNLGPLSNVIQARTGAAAVGSTSAGRQCGAGGSGEIFVGVAIGFLALLLSR